MGKNLYICLEYICCIYPRNGYSLLTSTSSITGRDTSPLPPPRGINSAHGSTSSLASNSNSNSNTTTTSRSEFFIPTQAITQQLQSQQQKQHNHHHQQPQHHHQHQQHQNNLHSANKLPTTTTTNTVFFNDFQNHNHSLNFNDIHEQFRQLVMKDILEYQAQREIKAQPLIQL